MVGVPLDQLVVWRVDHGSADVLVHEEQQRQTESQTGRSNHSSGGKGTEVHQVKDTCKKLTQYKCLAAQQEGRFAIIRPTTWATF